MLHAFSLVRPLLCALAVAGCANTDPATLIDNAAPGKLVDSEKYAAYRKTVATGGGLQADGTYQLNNQERQLDCKKLTGTIQVRLLDLRDYRERHKASLLARTVHGAAAMTGDGKYGADTDADYARERARLHALNNRLKEKGCKTIDIDGELNAPAAAKR
jgi:hypothetical protein